MLFVASCLLHMAFIAAYIPIPFVTIGIDFAAKTEKDELR
jgi:hypothetical protein